MLLVQLGLRVGVKVSIRLGLRLGLPFQGLSFMFTSFLVSLLSPPSWQQNRYCQKIMKF